MTWLIWTLVGFVVVVAFAFGAMWAIGRRLPPDHVTVAEIDIDHAMDGVWDAIADVAGHPSWSRINKVDRLPDIDSQEVWRQHFGRNSVVTRVTVRERPARYQQTIDDDHKFFSGTWTYELRAREAPSGQAGCCVRLTEHGRVHPAIPRFMMRNVVDPAVYLKGQLRALAQKFGSPPNVRVVNPTKG